MSDEKGQDRTARIGLSRPSGGGRLELKKSVETGVVRQSFSHGRSKSVAVEVKKSRAPVPPPRPFTSPAAATPPTPAVETRAAPPRPAPLHPVTPPVQARAPEPASAAPAAVEPRIEPQPAAVAPAAPAPSPEPAPPAAELVATPPVVTAAPEPVAAASAAEPAPPPAAPTPRPGPNMTAPPPPRPGPNMTAPPPPRPGPNMTAPPPARPIPGRPGAAAPARPVAGRPDTRADANRAGGGRRAVVLKPLTEEEKAVRLRALSSARKAEEEARSRALENSRRATEEAARRRAEEEAAAKRKADEEARRRQEEEARRRAEEQAAKLLAEEERRQKEREARGGAPAPATEVRRARPGAEPAEPEAARRPGARVVPEESADDRRKARGGKVEKRAAPRRTDRDVAAVPKRLDRLVLGGDAELVERRGPSLAALRRQRERERRQASGAAEFVVREVVLPETITVQDLAARMAIRGAEVVKVLMKNGILATINQTLDPDTAELVVSEFGHKVKRVSEADVEEGIEGVVDVEENLQPRPPIVTVMGHVDHGKTSLLDALRSSDVAAREAGGITQHIGAYQVDIGSGRPVTFIDTPGHAAFTAMRARGASVTDIVILVVAADDGVMPQTIEAISHAKAAKVPMVVAINKIDKPDANPDRVKQELLSHDVVLEDFGGDVLGIPVSAIKGTNLDKLIEAVQLQAELLDLRANPDREAHGTIVEAKLDRGRGVVATVLVQRGTLKVGDLVVAGAQWGRARALLNDRGQPVEAAGPSMPVEILGLDGVPEPGDLLAVVDSEKRAREITEYRQRKRRDQAHVTATGARGSLEDMFTQLRIGGEGELPVVLKSDVQGSLEALTAGLERIGTDEVKVRILFGGVGAITESDVTLAAASKAAILGFNVRANAQARDMARRDGVEIRYYSIIYELLDEMKALLSGMLKPESRESILGHAEIREIFSVPKIGKIAGCMVTDGLFKRNTRVRLLREDVVVYDGVLGSLRRFKDDVREVKEGFECGMSIENYGDIRQGDVIEAYEIEEVARSL